MQLPYSEELNIERLGRLFDSTSECYKLFWFKAIVEKVCEGKSMLSYEELVDEMIAEAWYMVTEYHLNLGPKDNLESVVNLIKEKNSGFKSSEKKTVILDYLANTDDKDVIEKKRVLIQNVPYRLQAPFLDDIKGKAWDIPKKELVEKINQNRHILYYFEAISGMMSTIIVRPEWIAYITKNQEILRGWLEYHMIHYLQRRNPSVPGIADKLYPPQERKLEKVKKYWNLILSIQSVDDIYSDQPLEVKKISIDHFVPWSYVAHDEMWNLNPTTRSINSSKSNNLPDWDLYFHKLAKQEYESYQLMWKYDAVHDEFVKCAKEHINSDDVMYRVYRKGLEEKAFEEELKSIIYPVYKSAENCGFGKWTY